MDRLPANKRRRWSAWGGFSLRMRRGCHVVQEVLRHWLTQGARAPHSSHVTKTMASVQGWNKSYIFYIWKFAVYVTKLHGKWILKKKTKTVRVYLYYLFILFYLVIKQKGTKVTYIAARCIKQTYRYNVISISRLSIQIYTMQSVPTSKISEKRTYSKKQSVCYC